jgi:heptaprenyl diphosphate synthase
MGSRADAEAVRIGHAGFFMALAAALQAAESLLPSPVPWFRAGFGNALVLAALDLWGARMALWVGLGKVLLGSLAAGRLFSPAFFLSLGGTLAALAAMTAALRLSPPLGLVGVSILGAAANAAAQLFLAAKWLVGSPAVWALTPFMGAAAVVSGTVTGLAAAYLVRVVERHSRNQPSEDVREGFTRRGREREVSPVRIRISPSGKESPSEGRDPVHPSTASPKRRR